MKTHAKRGVVASILIAAVLPIQLAAQDHAKPQNKQTRYVVKALSTLGGTAGGANGVTNNGWVTGWANLSGDQAEHGVLWRGQTMTDLGTLGGPNSAVSFPVKDGKGVIAGNSQISETDPLGENFCTFSTYTSFLCQGFRWQDGKMTALATLGGNNSWATVVNHRGQVAGFAENSTKDPNCIAPQVLDFEAVIWGPKEGEIQELPAFPGDTIGSAFGINDKGQAVGGSGICGSFTPLFYTHAVLWQGGSVRDLGSLGGLMLNAALFINNRGEVVGASDLAGDTNYHAFLWTEDHGMQDLGALPGDSVSGAESINEEGHVVGFSCDQNGNCRAVLWEDGAMTDINSLVLPGSSLYLVNASDINERGEIAGYAYDPSTGHTPPFLAIPCDDKHAGIESCDDSAKGTNAAVGEASEHPKFIVPEGARNLLRQRLRFGRFGTDPQYRDDPKEPI